MSEEPTKDFPRQMTFEERVLAEFAAINSQFSSINTQFSSINTQFAGVNVQLAAIRGDIAGLDARLTTLEDKVDVRLRETRPIWEAVLTKIDRLDEKFDTVIQDIYEVRTDIRQHAKRLTDIERQPNP